MRLVMLCVGVALAACGAPEYRCHDEVSPMTARLERLDRALWPHFGGVRTRGDGIEVAVLGEERLAWAQQRAAEVFAGQPVPQVVARPAELPAIWRTPAFFVEGMTMWDFDEFTRYIVLGVRGVEDVPRVEAALRDQAATASGLSGKLTEGEALDEAAFTRYIIVIGRMGCLVPGPG